VRGQRLRWVKPDSFTLPMAELGVGLAAGAQETTPPPSALMAALQTGVPLHDPPLSPRDEAVFLLHTAAEIEQALMVQYLYAAYSLKKPEQIPADDPLRTEHQQTVERWRSTLLSIAKEEMGHLMTVQNLLLLLGGPLNFEREDFPFRSDFYPFPFRLEPLTKESLAKYVLAEKGEEHTVPEDLLDRASTIGMPVSRVGALYARIYCIFTARETAGEDAWFPCSRLVTPELPDPHLADEDFVDGRRIAFYQGGEDWRMQGPGGFPDVLVPTVTSREQARQAIREIAEQGEGGTNEPGPTHFSRFLDIYNQFPETDPRRGPIEWVATRSAPADPNTLRRPGAESAAGAITHPRSRGWAELFNLRYRMLLACLSHVLQLDRSAPGLEERAQILAAQSLFSLMPGLSLIADLLLDLPLRTDEAAERSGPPFELPYTLGLPGREADRWRLHIHLRRLSRSLIGKLKTGARAGVEGDLLDSLEAEDLGALQDMERFLDA